MNIKKMIHDESIAGLFALFLIIVIFFGILFPQRFLTGQTFTSITSQLPELGLLTLAMFVPMLSGGLNLAIIATANLTSLLMASIFVHCIPPDAGMTMQIFWLFPALGAAIILAGLIGAVTGALVAYIGAHPILVTLATMKVVNGIGISLTRGAAISGMPEAVTFLGSADVFGIPLSMFLFLVLATALGLLLEKTRFGKYVYMIGSNIDATYFSGINTHRVQIAIYVLSSILCVFAGLVMMARFNSARMGYGDSYLLLTILAIILGGTNPFGGFGRVFAVVCALFVLQTMATGLNLMGVSPHFSLAMWGVVLVVALTARFIKRKWLTAKASRKNITGKRPDDSLLTTFRE